MSEFRLKRGYDIPLDGAAAPEIVNAPKPSSVALRPCDLPGVKLRLLVKEGDPVKIGTPLLHSKSREDWVFTSPGGGTVKAINRGHRRTLMSIVIELDENEEAEEFSSYDASALADLSREDVRKQLIASGLLSFFRERPFNYVANPEHEPRDIFVSTFDSAPLAPDLGLLVKDNETAFQAGLDVCSCLTDGRVHVALDGRRSDLPTAFVSAENVELHKFSGPHPAGCVGVQMHHIAPIKGRNDVVWHIDVAGLIAIGKLFLSGRFDPSTIVVVAGSSAAERKYYRTRFGAPIDSFVKTEGNDIRIITGNVLTGKKVEKEGFIGHYDNLVTVIPEPTEAEFAGWMLPGFDKASWFRGFMSKLIPGKKFAQPARMNGGHRAFVQSTIYEDVLPMDVLPVFLAKSCMYEDIEEMEQLGIYEVCEDEVALCEYICPSKTEFQTVIRNGLNLIEKEG